ncbi:MAG: OmpA family protein [Bacteroidetes bacterium]|nr:OmpA family protein [Bacteroidota bacterium]
MSITSVKKNDRLRDEYKWKVPTAIEGCVNAKSEKDSVSYISISHLDTSVNRAHIEFSPVMAGEKRLIFASLRTDDVLYYSSGDSNEVPVRKFYSAEKAISTWTFTGELAEPFNEPGVNTGNGAFSPDGSRFYFTKCRKNLKNRMQCSIYVTEMEAGRWMAAEKLDGEINLPGYTNTHPAVGKESGKNREVLYFVSDRPGGKGGMDIWYCVYQPDSRTYGSVKNAGGKINTPGNEITPYAESDSRNLYYSSDGMPGFGGYDIYRTAGEKSSWLSPKNCGYPLNTGADETYYSRQGQDETGFFTSNRTGSVALLHENCCDDIYSFTFTKLDYIALNGSLYALEDSSVISSMMANLEIAAPADGDLNYITVDSNRFFLLENTVVKLFQKDPVTGEYIFTSADTTDIYGAYSFRLDPGNEYRIEVRNYGNFDKQVPVNSIDISTGDTIVMQPIGINAFPQKPIVIKKIHYRFNSSELTNRAKEILDSTLVICLKENPDIIVEIYSHTDNIGSDAYNLDLSQKRAESVVRYLISKSIDKDRLIAKGLGESHPVDTNDTDEGREKNRRTEFRIIGSLSQLREIENEDE